MHADTDKKADSAAAPAAVGDSSGGGGVWYSCRFGSGVGFRV